MASPRSSHDFQDLWRVLCALTVVLCHIVGLKLVPGPDPITSRLAHLAVVVFFVISGFSVASSSTRYVGAGQFIAARWSRLYSVALPMLVFALALDWMMGAIVNPLYPNWQYSKWYAHMAINSVFLGEFWMATYRPFSIIPYWSLAYEFWYYVLFAILLYSKGRLKVALLIIVFLVMGPRMWLLLPCWYLGVISYRWFGQLRLNFSPSSASFIFIALFTLYQLSGLDASFATASVELCKSVESSMPHLFKCGYSRWFLGDYPVAIVFAFLVATVNSKSDFGDSRVAKWIRWFAPLTFGLYLGHYTLILAVLSRVGESPPVWLGWTLAVLIVFLSTLIGMLFDRGRPRLKRVIQSVFEATQKKVNIQI
jgi:peptidoglycan/LPS O-acetylase OafA/YrhL